MTSSTTPLLIKEEEEKQKNPAYRVEQYFLRHPACDRPWRFLPATEINVPPNDWMPLPGADTSNDEFTSKWMPPWAHAKINFYFGADDAYKVVGPAIPWTLWQLGVVWVFFLLFPLFAYSFTPYAEVGFAKYAPWLPLVALPVIAIALFLEFNAARFVWPAQLKVLGQFTIFYLKVPFRVWLGWILAISAVGLFDLVTNTLFMVKVVVTYIHGSDGSVAPRLEVGRIFEVTIQQSLLSWVPGLASAGGFTVLVIVGWLMMLMQPLCALGQSMPAGHEEARKMRRLNCYPRGNVFCFNTGGDLTYRTYMGTETSFGPAVMFLADAGRMACLSGQHNAYLAKVADSLLCEDLWPEIIRSERWFLLRTFTEVVFFQNLQCTAIALTAAASGGEVIDKQDLLSITLGVGFAAYSIAQDTQKFFLVKHMLEDLLKLYKSSSGWEHSVPELEASVKATKRAAVRFVIFLAVFALLELYVLLKIVMVFVCKDHMWNLLGCVDLSGLS